MLWLLLSNLSQAASSGKNSRCRDSGSKSQFPKSLEKVFVASDAQATESGLRQADYQRYGTPHRSMMRYCSKHPGSLGFVISQDGDVRVMTKVDDRFVIWENIQLQLPKFVSHKGPKRRRGRRLRSRRPSEAGGGV